MLRVSFPDVAERFFAIGEPHLAGDLVRQAPGGFDGTAPADHQDLPVHGVTRFYLPGNNSLGIPRP
jgi:hypothetical protein